MVEADDKATIEDLVIDEPEPSPDEDVEDEVGIPPPLNEVSLRQR
tara:strand:- start:387 stop:521 length:135 start_codon:yes stop_codon:yes gene_type:complete